MSETTERVEWDARTWPDLDWVTKTGTVVQRDTHWTRVQPDGGGHVLVLDNAVLRSTRSQG